MSIFRRKPRHEHDWSNWSDMEFVGSQYSAICGELYYAQRRRCLGCNEVEVKTTVLRGSLEEALKREADRQGNPLARF